MTIATFALILLGILIALFGIAAQGNLPFIVVGLLAIFGGGVLEVLQRRRRPEADAASDPPISTRRRRVVMTLVVVLAVAAVALVALVTLAVPRTTTTNAHASDFVSTFDPTAMASTLASSAGGPTCTAPPALSQVERLTTTGPLRRVLQATASIGCAYSGTDRQLVALWSALVADRIGHSDATVHGGGVSDGVQDEWVYWKNNGALDGDIRLGVLPNGPGSYWLTIDIVEVY